MDRFLLYIKTKLYIYSFSQVFAEAMTNTQFLMVSTHTVKIRDDLRVDWSVYKITKLY